MVKKAAKAVPNVPLRLARKERSWTQREVADRIGAPLALNVNRWERGVAFPSAYYVEKLCSLFGKSAKELGLLQEEIASTEPPSSPPAATEPTDSFSVPLVSIPLWNVPYRRNPFFTGRESLLTQLQGVLMSEQTAAITHSFALSGLGGIGKTQLAVEYAYRFAEAYRAVFWVRAASRDTLTSDYVSLANMVQLPEQNAQDHNVTVAAVKRWLMQHQGWLLILDNADDLSFIAEFLPTGGSGHVLLTTRSSITGKLARSVAVEKMDVDEGSLLLLRRIKLLPVEASLQMVSSSTLSQAQAIVKEVDGLPLALDQAGAYIEETGCSLSEYLQLYQQHRADLLSQQMDVSPDYPYTVASTWSLSFRQVEQANPAAADLLRLCAFLDPDAIPETMIAAGAAFLGSLLEPVVRDAFQMNQAIGVLRRFSLVRRDPETKILNLHRLVQVVLKDAMDEQTRRQWAERVVRAVNAAFPKGEFANWSRCQECLPHAQLCAELINEHKFTFSEASYLLHHAGWYLCERALYGQAKPLLTQGMTIQQQTLGPEHPDTATTLGTLARLYHLQGQYEQAESLYQHALTILEKALGSEHPKVGSIFNNLALLYYDQGLYRQAEPLCQRALLIREHALGPEHPDTAETLNYLAALYSYQGQYEQAEPLCRRAFTILEKSLGLRHPLTLATLNNLACFYDMQGKYAEAELLHQRALMIREQMLGPNHPDVFESLVNLSLLYYEQGKYEQAVFLGQRALEISEQMLGSNHPYMAVALNNLVLPYLAQDKREQAESLSRRSLAISEQVLGPNHPYVAQSCYNLARFYITQSEYELAESLCQRTLTICEQSLGLDHRYAAITLDTLGQIYTAQGKYEQAESFCQRALAIREQRFGPNHPDTAESLNSLAVLYRAQSRSDLAQLFFQRALSIREQVLGPDHPDTVATREGYSDLLQVPRA